MVARREVLVLWWIGKFCKVKENHLRLFPGWMDTGK